MDLKNLIYLILDLIFLEMTRIKKSQSHKNILSPWHKVCNNFKKQINNEFSHKRHYVTVTSLAMSLFFLSVSADFVQTSKNFLLPVNYLETTGKNFLAILTSLILVA